MDILPLQAINPPDYGLTLADVQREAWWITSEQRYAGHRAVAQALKACRPPWPWVGLVLDIVPFRWISGLGYRWVARNRGRLPGALPACRREEQPLNDRESVRKNG